MIATTSPIRNLTARPTRIHLGRPMPRYVPVIVRRGAWGHSDTFGRCEHCGATSIKGKCQGCGWVRECSWCRRIFTPAGYRVVHVWREPRATTSGMCGDCLATYHKEASAS